MSLYRKHQHLTRMVEWADNARLMFPVVLVMQVVGILDIIAGHAVNLLVLVWRGVMGRLLLVAEKVTRFI